MKMKEVHRMPLGFGPVKVPEVTQMAQVQAIELSYETEPELLKKLILPEEMELASPIVHVIFHKYSGCNLLAGRGYNSVILAFDCTRREEKGRYIAARFTSDMFTMIDGRYGDYGFPDLYAVIPDPAVREGAYHIMACEYDHCFLDIYASGFEELSAAELDKARQERYHQNWLLDHGEVTIVTRIDTMKRGEGSAVFTESSWFDAPDICQIANFMKALPVKKSLDAYRWCGAMEIGIGGEL